MGQKADELLGRLREGGVSIEESSALLWEVRREEAVEKAPNENPSHFEDEREQRLSDLWFSQMTTASIGQKGRVGLAFIAKFLGLGDDVAEKFAKGDDRAYHAVGLKQSAITSATDTSQFWEEIQRVFPEDYSDEDIEFLIRKGGVSAVLHLLWQLEIPLAEESPVLRSLARNAHAYR